MVNGQWSMISMLSNLPQPFAAHHAIHTHDDEGDAQDLTHVEGHALFEIHLHFLHKLHKETEGEDRGQTETEEKASPYPIPHLPVEDKTDDEDDEIGDGFVELGWMTRCQLAVYQTVVGMEDETPGQVRRTADDL